MIKEQEARGKGIILVHFDTLIALNQLNCVIFSHFETLKTSDWLSLAHFWHFQPDHQRKLQNLAFRNSLLHKELRNLLIFYCYFL